MKFLTALAAFVFAPVLFAADSAPPETRALVVLDSRLLRLVEKDLSAYVHAAEQRRGFSIGVMPVEGIDDWKPAKVRAAILEWLAAKPKVEGILFAGNIKLPSFF